MVEICDEALEVFDFKKVDLDSGKIYHYTKCITALNHILADGYLRLSPIRKANDPLGVKTNLVSFSDYPQDKKIYNVLSLSRREKVIDNVKLLCFTQDKPRKYIKNSEHFFYSGYGKLRMWAQYGENHKGVCLQFDKSVFTKSIKEIYKKNLYVRKVKYTNSLYNLSFGQIKGIPKDDEIERTIFNKYLNNLSYKALDWRDESEYRFIYYNPSEKHKYLYIDIKKSLTAIFAGNKFPNNYKTNLIGFGKKYNIPVYQISFLNGLPSLKLLR